MVLVLPAQNNGKSYDVIVPGSADVINVMVLLARFRTCYTRNSCFSPAQTNVNVNVVVARCLDNIMKREVCLPPA